MSVLLDDDEDDVVNNQTPYSRCWLLSLYNTIKHLLP